MGAVEQSYEAVESYLSTLDESYDSFTVNQRTLAVPTAQYEREREHAIAGTVDLYTKVRNDDSEILHVREEDELVLPSAKTATMMFERVATNAVEERTGVTCRVDGVAETTILGIHDATDAHETVYRLAVVFEATRQAGTPGKEAVWHATDRESELAFS